MSDRILVRHWLEAEGFATEITAVARESEFRRALEEMAFDIILSDKALPGFDGSKALRLVREKSPLLPFVFVTGSMGEEAAIETMKDGATDYVLKDRLHRLIPAVERAVRDAERAEKAFAATDALRASEERFRLIARASNDAIWDWDLAADTSWYSDSIRQFGYEDEDLRRCHRLWLERIHPAHQARVEAGLNAILCGRENYWSDEYPFLRKDGSVAHVFNRGYISRDSDGHAMRMVGAMMDITQRKLAEQLIVERSRMSALRAELANGFSSAAARNDYLQKCAEAVARHLDASLARIWMLDEPPNGLILRASAGSSRSLDDEQSRLTVGKSRVGRIARDGRAQTTSNLSDDSSDPLHGWAAREKVNGFAGQPLLVGERAVGVVAIFCSGPVHEFAMDAMAAAAREIALGVERRRADEIIREQAALLDQAQDAILVKDLQDRVVFWNKGAERIYGWPAAEAIGRKTAELIPSDPADYTDAKQHLLEHGSWTGNLVKTTRDGSKVSMECRWTLMRNPDGSPKSILAIDADVSGR